MSYLQFREKNNKDFIQQQIELKNSSNPYHVNQSIYHVRNEYDVFPYPNWYKGEASIDVPIVSEREAGWIPKKIVINEKKYVEPHPPPCFQSACSTVYPCYAQDNSYLYLNKACTITKQ